MAGSAPKTDNWTARENAHKPSGLHLLVSGCVQAGGGDAAPRLAEAAAQGRDPKILVLDLSIDAGREAGAKDQVWKPVDYHKVVDRDQFAGVEIRWGGKSIASCKVLDDDEHYQHLVALTQAANAKFAKKLPGKPKPAAPAKERAPASAKPTAKGKAAASPKKAASSSKRKTAAPAKRKPATAPKPKKASGAKRKPAAGTKRKSAGSAAGGRRSARAQAPKKRR